MKLCHLALAFSLLCGIQSSFATTNDIDQARLAYNLRTTVEAYDKSGTKNPKWDADVKTCLVDFAKSRSWTNGYPTNLIRGLQTKLSRLDVLKCDDPLIRYLYVRFVYSESHSASENAKSYGEAASALTNSQYSDIRKFYAVMWARSSLLTSEPKRPEIASLLHTATSLLAKALSDNTMPIGEVDQACDTLMSDLWWAHPTRWTCYAALDPELTKNWKSNSVALLAKGRGYLSYAWQARGTGYANTVSQNAAKLMSQRLDIAADSLEEAWKQDTSDSRICIEMMRVELGQGKGLDRLDLWFQRGMKLDPASYALCYEKLEYLRPRWYGSMKQMIDFGRECTLNTNWSGDARLMLATAHQEASREFQDNTQREAYWQQTNVWSDIHFAFEQFFKLYPEAVGYRHNYAWYADRCGKWQEFLNQIKLFPSTNYTYFGGKQQFDNMVKNAETHVKKP